MSLERAKKLHEATRRIVYKKSQRLEAKWNNASPAELQKLNDEVYALEREWYQVFAK